MDSSSTLSPLEKEIQPKKHKSKILPASEIQQSQSVFTQVANFTKSGLQRIPYFSPVMKH